MPYRPPVALYDACVLYPFHLRNLLIQCAVDRLVDARWTDENHEEWIRNLAANVPGVSIGRLHKTRDLMNSVLPDATVRDYQRHIPTITLPDQEDHHVVAAAIAARATYIVTWNIRDFPAEELTGHGLRVQDPDTFLLELYEAAPTVVIGAVANARRNLRKSATQAVDFLDALRQQRLSRFVAVMTRHLAEL